MTKSRDIIGVGNGNRFVPWRYSWSPFSNMVVDTHKVDSNGIEERESVTCPTIILER
jgi:hypothetical protein